MKRSITLALVLVLFVLAGVAFPDKVVLRKYGVETTIKIEIYDSNSPWRLYETAPAAADSFIVKNTKSPVTTTNAPTDRGKTHDVVLTATEMAATYLQWIGQDQDSPRLYGDAVITIETFGDPNALYAFDLDDAVPDVDVDSVGGSTDVVTALIAAYDTAWTTLWDPNGYFNVQVAEVSSGAGVMETADVRGAMRYLFKTAIDRADSNDNSVWANSHDLSHMLMAEAPTTVAAVTDATTFTLTAGSAVDDWYNQAMIVVQDVSDGNRRAVRICRNYIGGTLTVQLDEALPFLPAAADPVYIYMNRAVGRGRVVSP